MPKRLASSLTFYPAYCFSLSSAYSGWARLTAADIHALKEQPGFEGQNIYFHLNHPIKWIRLVGLVVAFDSLPGLFILTIDDGSGLNIEVKYLRSSQLSRPKENAKEEGQDEPVHVKLLQTEQPPDTSGVTATGRKVDLKGIDIGSVVKIKGGLSQFRGQKQITLERISIIQTTTEEAAAWAENTHFRREVLGQPWLLSQEEQQKAKEQVKGAERKRQLQEARERKKRISKAGKASIKAQKELRRREKERARLLREEAERKKREEEERKRAMEEELERRADMRRRRNEQRERALKELGAGR